MSCGVAGVNEMDVITALVTVSCAEEALPSREALMVVVPAATPKAEPAEVVMLLTVATDGELVVQPAEEETSCVAASVKVAVAVNLVCVPLAMLAEAGVIANEATFSTFT